MMMRRVILLVALVALMHDAQGGMSIDFGSEWMKSGVAVVRNKTRVQLQIVLNDESKRKEASVISFDKATGERTYGGTALTNAVRNPLQSYMHITSLIGRQYNEEHLERFGQKHFFPYEVTKSPDYNRFVLRLDEKTLLYPEELAASMIQHMKELGEKHANSAQGGVVVTVPAFFMQAQREAVRTAAEIAGFKVLGIMNGITAAALQYGLDRKFDKETHVLFYDMGASSTISAVVSFKAGKQGKLRVRGVSWDESLGGAQFTARLAEILTKKFLEQHGSKIKEDVTKNHRFLARMRKEAERVKLVLSANTEIPVTIESAYKDFDLKTHLSREEFESRCGDLFARVTKPALDAIKESGIEKSSLLSFEVIGGGVRVPRVRSVLREEMEMTISRTLNGDEAIAMGAAYYAASLSGSFSVPKYDVEDISPYAIRINITSNDPNFEPISEIPFPRGNRLPSKQLTRLKVKDDLIVSASYDDADSLPLGTLPEISKIRVSGVATAILVDGEKVIDSSLALPVLLSRDGMIGIEEPRFYVIKEKIQEVKASGKSSSKGTKASEKKDGKTESGSEEKDKEATSESAKEDAKGEPKVEAKDEPKVEAKDEPKVEPKFKVSNETIIHKLNAFDMGDFGRGRLTLGELAAIRARKTRMDRDDDERREREAAVNALESLAYAAKDKVAEDESFQQFSTEKEREEIVKVCGDIDDWIYGDGETASTAEYKKRKSDLQALLDRISNRIHERDTRSETIKIAEAEIRKARKFADPTVKSRKWLKESDLQELNDAISSLEKWLTETKEKQENLPLAQDPVLVRSDVVKRCAELRRLKDEIRSKEPKNPPPPPPKSEQDKDSSAKNGSKSDEKTETKEGGKEDSSAKNDEKTSSENAKESQKPETQEKESQKSAKNDEL